MNTYNFALELATRAHYGQYDKGGYPYIEHSIRVANNFTDPVLKTIAILHDTLEDTWLTKEIIEKLFGSSMATYVDALTRREDESYSEYIDRIINTSTYACKVKITDLEDNMNLARLKEITEEDINRVKKYEKTRNRLKKLLNEIESDYEDVY